MERLYRGRADGWRVGGGESLVAATSRLCILSPTNSRTESCKHPFSCSLAVCAAVCVHKKDAASVCGIISASLPTRAMKYLTETCVWS